MEERAIIEFGNDGSTVHELTLRALVIGVILGALLTAANTYLGLQLGMTVSASIPAAVLSMIILRSMRLKDVSILENNLVQTMASAGESLAAGVIFTVPALLVMGMEMRLLETFIIAVLGGILGTMFTITLRRVFIVEEQLPYPEGVACREVLVAGEKGGAGMTAIIYALGLGAMYGWVTKGFKIIGKHGEPHLSGAIDFLGTRLYIGFEMSLALVSVGYIVGIRIASFIFLGGVIGFMVLVPILGILQGWPVGMEPADAFMALWSEHIRFVGVGAMVVGGIYTLWSMRSTIAVGVGKAIKGARDDGRPVAREEQDIDIRTTFYVAGFIAVLTFLFYWYSIGNIVLAFVGALFLVVAAFFFSAVAGYIAGVVGSSNSPVSGMTIATPMATSLIVWIVGDLVMGMETQELMYATLLIASVVAVNAAIAGDVMQDLKTGYLVGATPWKQQLGETLGVLVGAMVAPFTVILLHRAFRITKTACYADPPAINGEIPTDPTLIAEACNGALLAPQAELIGAIIQGVFGGSINLPMVTLGVIIAALLIWKKLPVMSVAIGIYLPLQLSSSIMIGGLIAALLLGTARVRTDGDLVEPMSEDAEIMVKKTHDRGVLLSAGLIAGEALMGVVVALFIVFSDVVKGIRPPDEWLCSETAIDSEGASYCVERSLAVLPPSISALFFIWFVLIFVHLASQSLPRKENDVMVGNRPSPFNLPVLDIVYDSASVVKQGAIDLIENIRVNPPEK
ncbi:MAG: oligopeptide transporter, OPT family [Candidatus Thermoplasmatota archaeon]|nr:oligopeptide transporter, OPT family [Candidatus Thermoplasmatota archaeon]